MISKIPLPPEPPPAKPKPPKIRYETESSFLEIFDKIGAVLLIVFGFLIYILSPLFFIIIVFLYYIFSIKILGFIWNLFF